MELVVLPVNVLEQKRRVQEPVRPVEHGVLNHHADRKVQQEGGEGRQLERIALVAALHTHM